MSYLSDVQNISEGRHETWLQSFSGRANRVLGRRGDREITFHCLYFSILFTKNVNMHVTGPQSKSSYFLVRDVEGLFDGAGT